MIEFLIAWLNLEKRKKKKKGLEAKRSPLPVGLEEERGCQLRSTTSNTSL